MVSGSRTRSRGESHLANSPGASGYWRSLCGALRWSLISGASLADLMFEHAASRPCICHTAGAHRRLLKRSPEKKCLPFRRPCAEPVIRRAMILVVSLVKIFIRMRSRIVRAGVASRDPCNNCIAETFSGNAMSMIWVKVLAAARVLLGRNTSGKLESLAATIDWQ